MMYSVFLSKSDKPTLNYLYFSLSLIMVSVDTPGNAIEVGILGNYAYIADGDSGLQIIDISKFQE